MPHRPRPSKVASGSSRVGRLAKFSLSIYLLAAIFYTAYHFILAPAFAILIGGPRSDFEVVPTRPSPKVDVVQTTPLSLLPAQAKKHPALENAGVKAADIRNEDLGDRVWAAAEAADKAGKKEKPAQGYHPPAVLKDGSELVRKRLHGLDGAEWDVDQMHWHDPASKLAHSGPPSPHVAPGANREPVSLSEDHFLSLSFSSSLQPSKVIPYYYRASGPDTPGFNKEDITITTLVTSNRFKVFERLVERYQGA